METTFNRQQVSDEDIKKGIKHITDKLNYRLNQKGKGTFSSRHEILGIIEEEMHELKEAVKSNATYALSEELLDIAVASLFGYICSRFGYTDW